VDELYSRGTQARIEQRFDEAAELLRRALELEPGHADALVQLGFAELGRGDLAAARTAFSDALAAAPNYADAKFGMAQVEFRSGNPAAALAIVEPLAAEQPGNEEAKTLLASVRAALDAERKLPPAAPAVKTRPMETQPPPAKPDPVTALMEEARRLRTSGRFNEAEVLYRRALSLVPRNGDALVGLGLVSGARGRFEEAGRFFDAALAIDRNHFDARAGKARVAMWQGDFAGARRLADDLLQDFPDNPEAMLLDARIALLEGDHARAEQSFAVVAASDPSNAEALVGLGDARGARGDDAAARQAYEQALALEPNSADIAQRLAAPPRRKWRLDLGSEISELSAGLGTWTDSGAVLSYRLTPDTSVAARIRLATRFGRTDTQIEGRVDHAFAPSFSGFGAIAGTPDADFLAAFSIGGGASWRATEGVPLLGPVLLNLDARYDIFEESDIVTVSPWIQTYFFDERLGLSARWVHSQDDGGRRSDGYVVRADLTVTDRLRLFGGYGDAPEISDGTLVETRTIFGGAAFDLSDDLTLQSSYAHEQRPNFDRDIFGLGLAVRF
jgi:YaiO family outer membrane protein